MKHGHENTVHLNMKRLIAKLFTLLGWLVLFEEQLCDVLAWRINATGRLRLLAIEAERTNAHAPQNAAKDMARRCDSVLSVVCSERQRLALRRKLQRELPRKTWTKVGIVTIAQIARRLEQVEPKSFH